MFGIKVTLHQVPSLFSYLGLTTAQNIIFVLLYVCPDKSAVVVTHFFSYEHTYVILVLIAEKYANEIATSHVPYSYV